MKTRGFIDTFRHFYPDLVKYSWWSLLNLRRNKRPYNRGWRLDYFLISKAYETRYGIRLNDSIIENTQMGSDHCPIALMLTMPGDTISHEEYKVGEAVDQSLEESKETTEDSTVTKDSSSSSTPSKMGCLDGSSKTKRIQGSKRPTKTISKRDASHFRHTSRY